MTTQRPKKILVTGGNSGIGWALCRQLVADHDCHVLMGSRSRERGEQAIATLRADLPSEKHEAVKLLLLDVGDDDSVANAVVSVRAGLAEDEAIYALVNNAGIGLAANVSPEEVINTNLLGVRRMCEAFLASGLVRERVVNVGSGSGPGYVSRCPDAAQPALCREPEDWAAIASMLALDAQGRTGLGSDADVNGGYGISKALLSLYTMLLAKEYPEILSSCVSPGWIKTKLVGNSGATKSPEEGTVSIRHCLFERLEGNGWYYGSDALRSPLHYMRNPGEPSYDGVVRDR